MWILREILMRFKASEEGIAELLRPTTTKKCAKYLQKARFISYINALQAEEV